MHGCQFDWGGRLPKSNEGVQRITQPSIYWVLKRNGIKVCLTVRLTNRAGMKVGHSDPVVLYGKTIDQRIKGTLWITG